MVRKKAKKRVRKMKRAKSRFRKKGPGRPSASAPVHLTRVAELTQAQPIQLPTYPKSLASSATAGRVSGKSRGGTQGRRVKTMAAEIGKLLKVKRRRLTAPAAEGILLILRNL